MSIISKVVVVAVVVGVAGVLVYQGRLVSRQKAELADLERRLEAAEARQRRAGREMVDATRQLKAAVEAAASGAAASLAGAASPGGAVQVVSPAQAGAAGTTGSSALVLTTLDASAISPAGIQYRTPPMDPAVVTVLPRAEIFEQSYFTGSPEAPSWPELIKAGIGFREKAEGVGEYFSTHAVIAGLVESLRETSSLLDKDSGGNPDITQTLQKNYGATAARIAALAREIAARPNERPDAVEVSRQIESLAGVIVRRLPPEVRPPVQQLVEVK